MGIFSQTSKLAVTSLVLLLSEVSRQINMIVKRRVQEKTLRVYLVASFRLKSAFSIHIQSHMTPTTSVSYCWTPSLAPFLNQSYGISLNPLVSTYRKIRLEGKCHLRPCSQTRFNVVAVASAHNCIPLWHMLLRPCSLNLSYLATRTILVTCWHRKHRTIWQINLIKNNDGYFYMDKS